jgi:tight adherence protein C
MMLLLILGLALAGLSVALLLRAVAAGSLRSRELLTQIGAYGFVADGVAPEAKRPSLRETIGRLAVRLGARLEHRLGPETHRQLRTMLNSAGYYRTTVTRYLGYRLLAAIGAPLAFALLAGASGGISARALLGFAALAGVGWVLPPFLVKRKAHTRLERIDYEVPELVDLLVTTVEAGVGFAGALQLSARRIRGPLGQELRLALREQSMGLTMDQALRNLLERAHDSTSLRAFVQAIVQGETLGVSIGKILRDLAVDMRKRRRQAAEERAQKAPTKLLFPLVLLILPAMFIVVLGPTVYSIGRQIGG